MQPEWRRDGNELFFISADRKMMAVNVTTNGATFTAGVPHPLFEVVVPEAGAPYPNYASTGARGSGRVAEKSAAPCVPDRAVSSSKSGHLVQKRRSS